MGNIVLERVIKVIEYLGVTLDENFNWHSQVNKLTLKLSRSAGIISKLRHYIDMSSLIVVYYAIVYSYL